VTRLSLARSLLIGLVGLTIALSVVAGLGVAGLYGARQDYEDQLALAYTVEVSAANMLAAGVIEESVLRANTGRAARAQAQRAYEQAATATRRAALGDERSLELVDAITAAQRRARAAGGGPRLDRWLRESRSFATELAARQGRRRAEARDAAAADSRRSMITIGVAGGLALLAALAFVSALIGSIRSPLDALVRAARMLAAGQLKTRVKPSGPAELRELAEAFNSMADDLDRARAEVDNQRARLATIIESLGDGLVVCDRDGRVVQVNPRAIELAPTLAPGVVIAAESGPLPGLGETLDGEVQIEHRGRTLSVTAARLGDGDDHGVVWTMRDVSERSRLERLKSEFVATASHELRSPLTSIKGFVELLRRTQLNDKQGEFVDIIRLSTNRLVDLVNDLLDVARVEAGQLEIHRRPMSLVDAVEEVATLMRPRFEDRNQNLVLELPSALPAAFGDPGRVRQIITNLVTNAHLYTPEGGEIVVAAGVEEGALTLRVADNGIGMSAEQLDRVFDRFYRGASDGGEMMASGSGLGLAIVKSLVELHEGTIEVQSELAVGTAFTVRLPRAPAAVDMLSPRMALRGKRVLVVDDEPAVARLIAEQLEPYDVRATIVTSGEEAIRLLRSEEFDAMTLDILLGDMSGFEVLREVREDPELSRLPVVVVSVLSGGDALAGEWVISKPIEAEELVDAVGSAVLAGRSRVLVVGRAGSREMVAPALERLGIEFDWATSGAQASRLCQDRRFEVALVDAGLRSLPAIMSQLDLRGRRLRRTVIVFSTGEDAPGLARLDAEPVPVEDATNAVLAALGGAPGG
jgi:signal transduction histidine kinase/CheY-like chemotaxis protein/HAMP domain-containing protein